MNLREKVLRIGMDGISSSSCPMTAFGTRSVETLGSATVGNVN